LLISSFGVGLMIRSAIQLIWGPGTHVYIKGIQLPYRFEGLRVKPDHITIFLGTVLLVLLVHLFLTRTRLGKAMRAMADNPDLARISGINTDQVITVTWIVGAGLAAIAGFFLGLDTRLHPDMGWHFLLPVFAAAILGGVGKPYGAIAGGYIIGIAAEFSTLVISPAYKPAIAFSLMVLVLLLRPRGIFEGA
jgi:branched-chain amino acid transport system permease protein/neutral amino acid transport system permease protein